MDPRLKEPKVQVEVFKQLTSASPIDRHAAHRMLQRNGYNVEASVAEAKRWKAIQEEKRGQPTVPSNPNLDPKTAKDLTSIFAKGSSIEKQAAVRYCQREGINIKELREAAAKDVTAAPR